MDKKAKKLVDKCRLVIGYRDKYTDKLVIVNPTRLDIHPYKR